MCSSFLLFSAALTCLPFLFSLTLALSLILCSVLCLFFYLNLSGRSGRNCLLFFPVLSGCNRFLDAHCFQGTLWLISWPDGQCYSCPLQSLVVIVFLSLVSALLFSSRHTVSSKFFDKQVPLVLIEELVLPRHACCVLSCLPCNGHILLLSSYLSRIARIKNPSCSACIHLSSHSALSSYRLFALLALWQFSVSLRPLVQALGSCLASGAPWSSTMPPSLGRSQVTTTA